MQRKYGLGVPRAGLVALAVALVLTLLPATAFAAGAGRRRRSARPRPDHAGRDAPARTGSRVLEAAAAQRPIGLEARRVAALQRLLTRLGKRPGPVDGLFGPLTAGRRNPVSESRGRRGRWDRGAPDRPRPPRRHAPAYGSTGEPAQPRPPARAQFVAARPPTPVGIGASVADAAAPGQEEELKPELMPPWRCPCCSSRCCWAPCGDG